jgi:hypothetical protein
MTTITDAGWRPSRTRARSVGEFLPALMRPAFEKYGFSSASILTDWAALAGPELAAYTAPERLKWPRHMPGDKDASKTGATLILRVSGARALEERREPRPAPPQPSAEAEQLPALAGIREQRLRLAIARLASGVEARQRRD